MRNPNNRAFESGGQAFAYIAAGWTTGLLMIGLAWTQLLGAKVPRNLLVIVGIAALLGSGVVKYIPRRRDGAREIDVYREAVSRARLPAGFVAAGGGLVAGVFFSILAVVLTQIF